MVVTDDPGAGARRSGAFGTRVATRTATWLRHVRLGYNYRLDELSAALGVAQLERISELRARPSAGRRRVRGGPWAAGVDPAAAMRSPSESVDWFVYVVRLDAYHRP